MRHCPLCGRAYVTEDKVVAPPTREQVLALVRERSAAVKAARHAAPDTVAAAEPETPGEPSPTGWRQRLLASNGTGVLVPARVLSAGAAAVFVAAFALGEGVIVASGLTL